MRTRTLRGQLNDTNIHQIVVDDGRLNHGYIIKEFYVWPRGTGGDGVFGVLGTQYDMLSYADATDNRQIAWAGNTWSTSGTPTTGNWNVIDPDHVVIQDLFITATTGSNDSTNYLIVLEPLSMTEDQTILQLIKERSQDDTR